MRFSYVLWVGFFLTMLSTGSSVFAGKSDEDAALAKKICGGLLSEEDLCTLLDGQCTARVGLAAQKGVEEWVNTTLQGKAIKELVKRARFQRNAGGDTTDFNPEAREVALNALLKFMEANKDSRTGIGEPWEVGWLATNVTADPEPSLRKLTVQILALQYQKLNRFGIFATEEFKAEPFREFLSTLLPRSRGAKTPIEFQLSALDGLDILSKFTNIGPHASDASSEVRRKKVNSLKLEVGSQLVPLVLNAEVPPEVRVKIYRLLSNMFLGKVFDEINPHKDARHMTAFAHYYTQWNDRAQKELAQDLREGVQAFQNLVIRLWASNSLEGLELMQKEIASDLVSILADPTQIEISRVNPSIVFAGRGRVSTHFESICFEFLGLDDGRWRDSFNVVVALVDLGASFLPSNFLARALRIADEQIAMGKSHWDFVLDRILSIETLNAFEEVRREIGPERADKLLHAFAALVETNYHYADVDTFSGLANSKLPPSKLRVLKDIRYFTNSFRVIKYLEENNYVPKDSVLARHFDKALVLIDRALKILRSPTLAFQESPTDKDITPADKTGELDPQDIVALRNKLLSAPEVTFLKEPPSEKLLSNANVTVPFDVEKFEKKNASLEPVLETSPQPGFWQRIVKWFRN